jgi:D-glycerate 3-kinase
MTAVNECFGKIKSDCFKYIKSQETNTEKFKNKDKMIKSFLIPLCFWISKRKGNKKSLILGIAGGQGTGKTTITSIISIILKKYFKLNVFTISIDDFYRTRKERFKLSQEIHPLLLIRGVPGTHDTNIMLNFLKKIKNKNFNNISLPRFDKAIDDRFPKSAWHKINKKPDIIILEGWCVGAKAQSNKQLIKAVNSEEKAKDHKMIWRKYVNNQLKNKYKKLFNQLNCLIYLKVKNFSLLQNWRLMQEKKLWLSSKKKKNLKIMSKGDVINFMQTYQRITQNMFKETPKYASIILKLTSNHQIKSMIYKKNY